MKAVILASVLAISSAASLEAYAGQFEQWKASHGRKYATTEEHQTRLANFAAAAQKVARLNAAEGVYKHGATFQLNKFADKSEAELAVLRGIKGASPTWRANATVAKVALKAPTSVDWRSKGVLSPIQDQGQCGSCWAFSATATLESQAAIASGSSPKKLSEQFLVDCDQQCGTYRQEQGCDNGCNGGLQPNAWIFVSKTSGQPSESDYPYQGVGGTCQSSYAGVTKPSSWEFAPQDEGQIAAYVAANGPVSVALDASNWSYYTGGIMQSSSICPKGDSWDSLDHGVNIVGYGSEGGVDYWIIRNSWNTDWGENGYARIIRGQGFCGVQLFVCRALMQ
jgi:cathepsin F